MNLADTLTAIQGYYETVLDDAAAPPCYSYLYWGQTEAWPPLCDCECGTDGDGVLRLSWRVIGPSSRPPALETVLAPGALVMVAEITVRLMRCWPTGQHSVDEWEAAALAAADDAGILAEATHRLVCSVGPLGASVIPDAGCYPIGGYRVEPVYPEGGCAGTQITLYAKLTG